MRYYIIAGEASGDLHGSNLIKEIIKKDPAADIRCWGGKKMQDAGGFIVRDYRENAVMGIVEVISHLGKISKNLKFCCSDIMEFAPDAIILIDYPGFNLKIAKFAHNKGFKVFYYIPPKVWARGESRIKKLKRFIDHTYIIFPFEVNYFRKKEIDVSYYGNPLTDSIDHALANGPAREEFFQAHSIDPNRPCIALLAGSRKMEINYLLPRMIETIKRLRSKYGDRYQYLLAGAPGCTPEDYSAAGAEKDIHILFDETYHILKYSEAAIISSGTASLEAAIIGTPQVVCYGLNPISFAIGKIIVKIDTVSLANLILGKHIFKELLQDQCTPEAISSEIIRLTEDNDYRAGILENYNKMRALLGERGSAGRIAEDIVKRIESNK